MNYLGEECPICKRIMAVDSEQYYWHIMIHKAKKEDKTEKSYWQFRAESKKERK